MASLIQLRHDTPANWTLVNPILAQGELGTEITTKFFKIGNGTTAWNALEYANLNPVLSVNGATGAVTITAITPAQAAEIVANTAKTGITTAQAAAIAANTAKTGITAAQAAEIAANTAKTGITVAQALAIIANTAKVSYTPAAPGELGATTPAASTFTNVKVNGPATADVLANTQTGTAYTLALLDAGKLVTLSNAAAVTLTIPSNAAAAFRVGTVINLLSLGAGLVTVAITGDSLVSKGALVKLTAQYSAASLVKTAATSWVLFGDLA
jgi:hypothetical protein